MTLAPGCPRCPTPVVETAAGARWSCPAHGPVQPLWRPHEASYAAFTEHLGASEQLPTYLPWPIAAGWSVTDFGVVGRRDRPLATMTCSSGTSEADGPVDLLVVTEEAGTGLGARCAGLGDGDPGSGIGVGPPVARVQIDKTTVALWHVSTSASAQEFDRSVVAGEVDGRWLWLVLRPAAAMLLLGKTLLLRDISRLGPPLLELPFGGPKPPW